MTRKAINFDLDTHKLEEWYPTPNWRNAYMDIRNYMQEHGFENEKSKIQEEAKEIMIEDLEIDK